MNVVVTGATGFVGTPLVRALLAAGHTVTALTRDAQRAVRRLPARCTVQSWNPAQALDPSMLRGADAIVHLAGWMVRRDLEAVFDFRRQRIQEILA